MDNIQIQCNRLANTLKSKHELDTIQGIALDQAISQYDYLQNDGTIFTNTLDILECFINDEQPIAPSKNCIIALCEYIIGTIQFYDVPIPTLTIKSRADEQAQILLITTKGV